jgi:uncharacterized 2Fe-2S/4Fe-4S cluster protein (DUF4445 family)
VRVDIPPEALTAPQRLQIEGQGIEVGLDPIIVPLDLQVTPPDLYDLRPDVSRLQDALAAHGRRPVKIDLPVLAGLPERLRVQGWSARLALRKGEERPQLVGVLAPQARLFGLAVDVGTTKLAAYLVDLATGETVAKAGAMNPQIAYGEDVISRIAYANEHPDGRQTLQGRLVETLNQMAGGLCAEAGATREQVVEAVIVGNTAMHHLFAGLPVRQLGLAPYVPVTGDALELRAGDLGLDLAAGAAVYLPPNIAGYVGADHVAMLLAMDVANSQQPVVALDIGTNTEITLAFPAALAATDPQVASAGRQTRLLSCSCASGPAFEGAHIHAGMRAAPGAIERLQIVDEQVLTHTIGGLAPVGICGSGILDAVAEMLAAGVLDLRGVLKEGHVNTRRVDGKVAFVLAPAEATGHGRDLIVRREDVKEIQLAKGAIRAGIEILLAEAGLRLDDIQEFVVAGAFGTYLDLRSAIRVGMFPDLPMGRFRQVGNAAGTGARQLLVSAAQRQEAARIARQVEYIELTTHPEFTQAFVKALTFEV